MRGMCDEQDDEMLVSMASAHGGSGDDADARPEQQASDMELLYQVRGYPQVAVCRAVADINSTGTSCLLTALLCSSAHTLGNAARGAERVA